MNFGGHLRDKMNILIYWVPAMCWALLGTEAKEERQVTQKFSRLEFVIFNIIVTTNLNISVRNCERPREVRWPLPKEYVALPGSS